MVGISLEGSMLERVIKRSSSFRVYGPGLEKWLAGTPSAFLLVLLRSITCGIVNVTRLDLNRVFAM